MRRVRNISLIQFKDIIHVALTNLMAANVYDRIVNKLSTQAQSPLVYAHL